LYDNIGAKENTMVSIKWVYILRTQHGFFTGSTFTPEKVLESFRANDPTAEYQVICALMLREAANAVRFLRSKMTDVDFRYWGKQKGSQQARWIFKAANSEPALAKDYSDEFNRKR
jgi:hypothetical protein